MFESTEMIASRNGMRHTMRILTRNRCMDAKFSRSTAALEFVKKAIVHVRPPPGRILLPHTEEQTNN